MTNVTISKYDNIMIDYDIMTKKLEEFKKKNPKPLTYAEKILYTHLDDPNQEIIKVKGYLNIRPTRVAMQDATAQMAVLQFMSSGISKVQCPTTVHTDHLIKATSAGGIEDLADAKGYNKEVYDFLSSAANKYGMGYWKPGAGIIHQIVLENYAFPGGIIIGTDSHTPNAGGLGMIAIGIGGADAVDVMAGLPLEIKAPMIMGVKLTGKLNGWCSAKDVILEVCKKLTTAGGTNYILEYFGEGVSSLSCTGMATITNMGAEVGATCSIFPFTDSMAEYLKATKRSDIAELAYKYKDLLKADEGCEYDKIIEIDLSKLEPHLNGPNTPDKSTNISDMVEACKENEWPTVLSVGLIGSCTNSSYEDMTRAADVCRQAIEKGLKMKSLFYIAPGSEQVRETMERDGIAKLFRQVGGKIMASACGPCIGQWKRDDITSGKNSILHSFNRNFRARADGNPETCAFISSPEIVTAKAIAGSLTFNPLTDKLVDSNGNEFMLEPPKSTFLPPKGFICEEDVYVAPAQDGSNIEVIIPPESKRLQRLQPFKPFDGKNPKDLPILIKVKGKCTTDHISAAGKWLQFRGHIDNISDNLLIGATNADNDKVNSVYDVIDSTYKTVPEVARHYKQSGIQWVVIGDTNYGEGSSREHAAIEPRYLNGFAIISKGFARIHETNLKKQGILPLTFDDVSDYDKITGKDRVSFPDITEIQPGKQITMIVKSNDKEFKVMLNHTLNEQQIKWFKGGSALNILAKEAANKK